MGLVSILRLIAGNEEKIMELYSLYAEEFPERADFWMKIAGDESVHAELVKELARMEASGKAVFDKKRFAERDVKALTKVIDREYKQAYSHKVSYHQALSAASEIETNLLEMEVFDSSGPDQPQTREMLSSIKSETFGHLKTILEEIRKYGKKTGI